MITIRKQYSDQFTETRRKNKGKSMTVPDQSMTVKEILTRFASGIPVTNIMNIPVYNGEEDIWDGRDPKSLDVVELNDTLRAKIQATQEEIKRVEKDVAERTAAAAKIKSDREAKEIQEAVERREKEIDRLMGKRYRPQSNQGEQEY